MKKLGAEAIGCLVLGTQDAKMEIPVITESAGGMGDI
jgi:hypothetical protein